MATDACEEFGLNVIELPADVREGLKEKLPPECILRNPLDLTGSATSQMYDEALAALGKSKKINSVIVIVGDPMPDISKVIAKHRSHGKIIIPVMLGGGKVEVEERAKLQKLHIPVFPSPLRAARVLSVLTRHAQS